MKQPEMRRDLLRHEWVIVAPERDLRPYYSVRPGEGLPAREEPHCPFCPGQEHQTPPELDRTGTAAAWKLRVVPNLFPALRVEVALRAEPRGQSDWFAGVGAHEVVVLGPGHEGRPADLGGAVWLELNSLVGRRVRDLRKDIRLKVFSLFANVGYLAGMSLPHPHAQLMALPLVPRELEHRQGFWQGHYARTGRCPLCDLLAEEGGDGRRVVWASEHWLAVVPFAAPVSHQVVLLPRRHVSNWLDLSREAVEEWSRIVPRLFGVLDGMLERPDLHWILHGLGAEQAPWQHCWMEITPVLGLIGGVEKGTGIRINPVRPEDAAQDFRKYLG